MNFASVVAASLLVVSLVDIDALDVTTDKTGFLDGVVRLDSNGSNKVNNNNIFDNHNTSFTRIVGGIVASTKRYPYFTVLFRQTEENGTDFLRFTCGGSLIRDYVVVTAGRSTSRLQQF